MHPTLAKALDDLRDASTRYFGYPEIAVDADMAKALAPFQQFHLNNVGDPWQVGNWSLHTKQFEQEVIHYFAKLYHIESDYWGYITNGGTEGNVFGIYQARSDLSQYGTPTVLTSKAAHYSITKAAHLLAVPLSLVDTQSNGELCYENFRAQVRQYRHTPLIIVMNLGTTMTGAMDCVQQISAILDDAAVAQYRIHVDAALHGGFYPWISNAVDLFASGVSSIAISGHKFMGSLSPCGIFLTRQSTKNKSFSHTEVIPVIDSQDPFISSSRDGMHALRLWYLIQRKGVDGFKQDYQYSVDLAEYFKSKLRKIGIEHIDIPEQVIVAFKLSNTSLAKQYQLPLDTQGYSHIVCRCDITRDDIDTILELLKN